MAAHIGQAFYLYNKQELDKQSGWFTNDQGKINGRIKIEKQDAEIFFINWSTKNVKPSKDTFTTISVDPEDGRGGADDPLPAKAFKGIKDWNHSDK